MWQLWPRPQGHLVPVVFRFWYISLHTFIFFKYTIDSWKCCWCWMIRSVPKHDCPFVGHICYREMVSTFNHADMCIMYSIHGVIQRMGCFTPFQIFFNRLIWLLESIWENMCTVCAIIAYKYLFLLTRSSPSSSK